MKFDTTSLGNAVRRLRQGPARCEREPADEQIRDGLIHRFEFTYELSHKMLGCPVPIWSGPRILRACCGATGRFGGAL